MARSDMAHVMSFMRKEETAIRLQVDALLTENDRAVTQQPNSEGSLVTEFLNHLEAFAFSVKNNWKKVQDGRGFSLLLHSNTP